MHPLHAPVEPHFVHLSWAVRRLTPTQARYIQLFYGEETLHQLEDLEHRHPSNGQLQHAHVLHVTRRASRPERAGPRLVAPLLSAEQPHHRVRTPRDTAVPGFFFPRTAGLSSPAQPSAPLRRAR